MGSDGAGCEGADSSDVAGSGPMRGLDDACSKCARRVGDHTMDEFNVCSSSGAMDLSYEEAPGGPIPLTIGGERMEWADHLHCRSAVIAGESFGANLRVRYPTVIFTFEIGNTKGAPYPVTEVAFVGPPDVLRKLGTVIRDTCDGAANAAERTA